MTRIFGALILVAIGLWASNSIALPDDPDDAVALENVWDNTLVVFPHLPTSYITRGRDLDKILEMRPMTEKSPAVIFLHGSTGLSTTSPQTTRIIRNMAEAGYVVFAPDSMARPVPPYADPKTFKSRIGVKEVQGRIAEADMVRSRISKFTWIDANNIFVSGFSMGGMAVHNIATGDYRGYAILGYHCGPHLYRQLEGIKIPRDKPIIAMRGASDEWYVNGPNASVNCGMYMKGFSNAESKVYPNTPHDISQHPEAMPDLIAFLKRNTASPAQ